MCRCVGCSYNYYVINKLSSVSTERECFCWTGTERFTLIQGLQKKKEPMGTEILFLLEQRSHSISSETALNARPDDSLPGHFLHQLRQAVPESLSALRRAAHFAVLQQWPFTAYASLAKTPKSTGTVAFCKSFSGL